jgi:F0F1-type ATP synthase alpha subunit
LKQKPYRPYTLLAEILLVAAGTKGFLDKLAVNKIAAFKDVVYKVTSLAKNSAVLNLSTIISIIDDRGGSFTFDMFMKEASFLLRTLVKTT